MAVLGFLWVFCIVSSMKVQQSKQSLFTILIAAPIFRILFVAQPFF